MIPFHLEPPSAGPVPLLVSIPHGGTELPDAIRARLTAEAVALPDTDWHLGRLYDFAPALGATVLAARHSRYVVDLNRPPDARPLYPGRFETTVVPTTTFDDRPLYREGEAPDDAEIAERIEAYWRPYHAALERELARLRDRFGYALLFEAHSIRSEVPLLFEGRLPDLVLGTADGASVAAPIARAVEAVHAASGLAHATNRPFKGGYITRTRGRPESGVHAIQLEMAQALYMDEAPPYPYRPDLAAALRPVLEATLGAFVAAAAEAH